MSIWWLDIWRLLALALAGVCVGLKLPILRHHIQTLHLLRERGGRGLRYDDVKGPMVLRSVAHSLGVLYVAVSVAERIGLGFSWRLPAATAVFVVTIAGLISTHRSDRVALAEHEAAVAAALEAMHEAFGEGHDERQVAELFAAVGKSLGPAPDRSHPSADSA